MWTSRRTIVTNCNEKHLINHNVAETVSDLKKTANKTLPFMYVNIVGIFFSVEPFKIEVVLFLKTLTCPRHLK